MGNNKLISQGMKSISGIGNEIPQGNHSNGKYLGNIKVEFPGAND
jgi:hypothetical protein